MAAERDHVPADVHAAYQVQPGAGASRAASKRSVHLPTRCFTADQHDPRRLAAKSRCRYTASSVVPWRGTSARVPARSNGAHPAGRRRDEFCGENGVIGGAVSSEDATTTTSLTPPNSDPAPTGIDFRRTDRLRCGHLQLNPELPDALHGELCTPRASSTAMQCTENDHSAADYDAAHSCCSLRRLLADHLQSTSTESKWRRP